MNSTWLRPCATKVFANTTIVDGSINSSDYSFSTQNASSSKKPSILLQLKRTSSFCFSSGSTESRPCPEQLLCQAGPQLTRAISFINKFNLIQTTLFAKPAFCVPSRKISSLWAGTSQPLVHLCIHSS